MSDLVKISATIPTKSGSDHALTESGDNLSSYDNVLINTLINSTPSEKQYSNMSLE